jgi:hypothetical protein
VAWKFSFWSIHRQSRGQAHFGIVACKSEYSA